MDCSNNTCTPSLFHGKCACIRFPIVCACWCLGGEGLSIRSTSTSQGGDDGLVDEGGSMPSRRVGGGGGGEIVVRPQMTASPAVQVSTQILPIEYIYNADNIQIMLTLCTESATIVPPKRKQSTDNAHNKLRSGGGQK